jgi:hypothetical protein
MIAHRLGGSSGSYGHAALGVMLAAIERELETGAGGDLDALLETARAYVLHAQSGGS